jgi:hypothetical protein
MFKTFYSPPAPLLSGKKLELPASTLKRNEGILENLPD